MTTREKAKCSIHATAAASAITVAVLPVGADVVALRAAEIAMIISIGTFYNAKLTKSAASGLMASGFAAGVGEKAAIAALEASNAAGLLAYGIKLGIATALIEAIGHCAIDYFEKECSDKLLIECEGKEDNKRNNEIGSKVFKGLMAAGVVFDVTKITENISERMTENIAVTDATNGSAGLVENNGRFIEGDSQISFKGEFPDTKKECEDLLKELKKERKGNLNKIDDLQKSITGRKIENATGGIYNPETLIRYDTYKVQDLCRDTEKLDRKIRNLESTLINKF